MHRTGGDVAATIAQVTPAARRRDAERLAALLADVTGREPELWSGGIIGFGACHYRYPTGAEGDSPIVGFAPRKRACTLYLLDGIDAHAADLAVLGPHSTGVGCLYVSDLGAVDEAVLRRILTTSFDSVGSVDDADGILTVID
ncbi:DUF1801 domain-containing protein [Microbacterium sp. 18062]|uniref:DUF1801 domain-containing protein n=1 Tax=Microbacterium sp. 18062 TaxID=2681410 RepID=UPI0013567551|nr:DUF1801 domain-containing protein [Microbacterium sp. 18062]